MEEEGFYYQILDDSHAVLLCPVDPSKVAAELFTLETIGDVPLTGTTKYAFYGCTQLKTISVRSYYTDLHEEALLPCPQAKLIYEARYLHRVEDTSLSLEGDTKAELENACLAAVGGFSKNGPATFTTNGLVSSQVTSDAYDHSGATGIEVYAEGPESSVSVTIGGGIRAVSRSTDCEKVGNVDTAGISVDVADGGKADISVSGGIFADSVFDEEDGYGWTAGLHHGNSGGNVNIQINGDVTAKSHIYGVGLNVSMLEAAQLIP